MMATELRVMRVLFHSPLYSINEKYTNKKKKQN